MHKMGRHGPKRYIFGDQFYSKNAKKLRLHVFLHFNDRKRLISPFHLKLTEFTRNCEFCSNLVWVHGDAKLGKSSQFLVNLLQTGKMMILYQFAIFKPLKYCFEETIRFDVRASFANCSVSRLIRWYNKPGDIAKELSEKAIHFHGTFHGLKITSWYVSSMKREEYMESELSGIFRVKVVAKII